VHARARMDCRVATEPVLRPSERILRIYNCDCRFYIWYNIYFWFKVSDQNLGSSCLLYTIYNKSMNVAERNTKIISVSIYRGAVCAKRLCQRRAISIVTMFANSRAGLRCRYKLPGPGDSEGTRVCCICFCLTR
jgi:hypothetical protein